MSEEKKEEKKEPELSGEKEPVQKQAVEETSEKEAVQKAVAEKGSSTKQKVERPKNCSRCNKPIKRKTWYYRNGKYFCGKGCWKLSQQKEKAA